MGTTAGSIIGAEDEIDVGMPHLGGRGGEVLYASVWISGRGTRSNGGSLSLMGEPEQLDRLAEALTRAVERARAEEPELRAKREREATS